jgi:hypothetical protein
MTTLPSDGGDSRQNNSRAWLGCGVVAGAVLMMIIALFWPRPAKVVSPVGPDPRPSPLPPSEAAMEAAASLRRFGLGKSLNAPKSAEEIVADKVRQFGRNRRAIVERIAARRNEALPPEIDAFFKAVDKGDWDEIDRLWKDLAKHATVQYENSEGDRSDLRPYWPSVLDAYGVAEQAHLWPAQKLLDYGNAIMDSLRPGEIFVGGTDNGRWVPELMNETSGDPHIMITQNALADGGYLDFVRELYGEQFSALSPEDSQRGFEAYVADAQKRFQHDLDFPDEPKQVLPGENIKMVNGKIEYSGQVAVMGINEKLLQLLMEKNPDLSFAMQESFAMNNLYPDALPVGPLMELNAHGEPFNADYAGQSVDYWRSTAQTLLADPQASGSEYTLRAYSKDMNSTANLLAAHNFTTEAADAYRLASQVWPANAESVEGLARVMVQAGQREQARALLNDFAQKYPNQRTAVQQASVTILWTRP